MEGEPPVDSHLLHRSHPSPKRARIRESVRPRRDEPHDGRSPNVASFCFAHIIRTQKGALVHLLDRFHHSKLSTAENGQALTQFRWGTMDVHGCRCINLSFGGGDPPNSPFSVYKPFSIISAIGGQHPPRKSSQARVMVSGRVGPWI